VLGQDQGGAGEVVQAEDPGGGQEVLQGGGSCVVQEEALRGA